MKKLSMFISKFKYNISFFEYANNNLTAKDCKMFISLRDNLSLIKKYNNSKYTYIYDDKALFNRQFINYLNRNFIYLTDILEFKKFLKNKEYVVAKHLKNKKLYKKIRINDYNISSLFNELIGQELLMIEDILENNLSEMFGEDVFLRVNTFTNYNTSILSSELVLRETIDEKVYALVDNFIIVSPLLLKKYNEITILNDKVIGFKIPFENNIIEFLNLINKEIDFIKYASYDLNIGKEISVINGSCRPEIIQGNFLTGYLTNAQNKYKLLISGDEINEF